MIAINQDVSPQSLAPGYYVYAKNILVNNIYDEVEGERGFVSIPLNEFAFKFINGLLTLENLVYIFGKNFSDQDIIVEYNEITKVRTELVNRTDLGFNEDNPITGKLKKSQIGEVVVVFRDSINPPRYINFGRYNNSLPIERLNLFSTYSQPTIIASAVQGGTYKTGTYFVLLQYIDNVNNTSDPSILSNPVYVLADSSFGTFKDNSFYKGGETGKSSNTAIRVQVANLDTTFDRVNIIVVEKTLGNTISYIAKTTTIGESTSLDILLTGSEIKTTITLEEALTQSPYYDRIGEVESLNDQLFLADLKIQEILNFQSIANQVQLKWRSNSVTQRNELNDTYKQITDKTFAHDEVYAMYIQFEVDNVRLTDYFHIPGRLLTNSEKNDAITSEVITIGGRNAKAYEVQDTVGSLSITGVMNTLNNSTAFAEGTFSGWENSNETYPSNFPDFPNQPVRHHKFPSLKYVIQQLYGSNGYVPLDQWSQLSVVISNFPFASNSRITGYRLGYALRDTANISVVGYDIVQVQSNPAFSEGARVNTRFQNTGGNWGKRDTGAGDQGDAYPNDRFLRMHCPELFINRPNISDHYIVGQVKLRYQNARLKNTFSPGYAPHGMYTRGGSATLYSGLVGYTCKVPEPAFPSITISVPEYHRNIKSYSYIKNGVNQAVADGTVENLHGEEHLHIALNNSIPLSSAPAGHILLTNSTLAVQANTSDVAQGDGFFEEVDLVTFKKPVSNFFLEYTNQQIVPCEFVKKEAGFVKKTFYEGDLFICRHSFLSCGSIKVDQTFPGIRFTKIFTLESRYNLNQRYITEGDPSTYFYPRVGDIILSDPAQYWFASINRSTETEPLSTNVNTINYDTSFNSINNLEQYSIYNVEKEYISEYPYAIIRGRKSQQGILLQDGWKKFAANDIFYTVTDKGKIIKLQAIGRDSLIIHHEDALYKTAPNVVLQSNIGAISAGSGEIFRIEPVDIKPNNQGFAGLQHKFAALLTPDGYLFLDARRGDLYLYGDGGLATITAGVKNLLRDNLSIIEGGLPRELKDNPYKDEGIQVAYDTLHNRSIISSLAGNKSFTMTYDSGRKGVVSFHDYIPHGMIGTPRSLYSLDSVGLFEHNIGDYGIYYSGVRKSWYIDVVINEEPKLTKILSVVSFVTTKDNLIDLGITHITVKTGTFNTGKIALSKDISLYEKYNTRRVDEEYSFNQIRNRLISGIRVNTNLFENFTNADSDFSPFINPFESEKLRDKFFIVRFESDNLSNLRTALRSYSYTIRPSSS